MLAELKAKGIRACIITNGHHKVCNNDDSAPTAFDIYNLLQL
jgi:hypothetical protein